MTYFVVFLQQKVLVFVLHLFDQFKPPFVLKSELLVLHLETIYSLE